MSERHITDKDIISKFSKFQVGDSVYTLEDVLTKKWVLLRKSKRAVKSISLKCDYSPDILVSELDDYRIKNEKYAFTYTLVDSDSCILADNLLSANVSNRHLNAVVSSYRCKVGRCKLIDKFLIAIYIILGQVLLVTLICCVVSDSEMTRLVSFIFSVIFGVLVHFKVLFDVVRNSHNAKLVRK